MTKPTDSIVKRKPGRPQKFSKEQLEAIYNELSKYIEEQEDPTIPDFIATHSYSLNKEFVSSRKEFSDLKTRIILKQEAFLLKQYKNPAMAIFRLKQPQHGYTDKHEVEAHNINLDVKADADMAKDFAAFLKQQTHQG